MGVLSLFIARIVCLAIAFQGASYTDVRVRTPAFEPSIPLGISRTLWRRRIPVDNPITRDKVSLGETLYFDKRLSINGTVSCATCHDPANSFTDRRTLALGVSNNLGTRNAPTILNAMFVSQLFWDGRAGRLEEQAKQPLLNPLEMGMGDDGSVVSRLNAIPEYRIKFNQVFGKQGISIDTITKAIAAYERTLLSGNSAFDRFITGDTTALTEAQERGWKLFKGKAKCTECHSFSKDSPFFSDFKFHNTGVGAADLCFAVENSTETFENSASALAHTRGSTELGRYLVTKNREDLGAFRTPSLRDVELTAPYMHNGSEKTLIDVVRFYNRGGNGNPNLDRRIVPLKLTDSEISELVEFMRALTSSDVLRHTQSSTPQNRLPVSF